MTFAPMLFESAMIVCFGVSWPSAIIKTLRTKTVEGISVIFLWFVFSGYVSGVLFKLSEIPGRGRVSPVVALYALNGIMVGIELVLYYRFRVRPADRYQDPAG